MAKTEPPTVTTEMLRLRMKRVPLFILATGFYVRHFIYMALANYVAIAHNNGCFATYKYTFISFFHHIAHSDCRQIIYQIAPTLLSRTQ